MRKKQFDLRVRIKVIVPWLYRRTRNGGARNLVTAPGVHCCCLDDARLTVRSRKGHVRGVARENFAFEILIRGNRLTDITQVII
ncbi:hypothetical protein GHT06_022391 [Daphnia sinensis]|uniref:Uncharacterized protein n=1 Tax=Daphnia sinensis TaxID=1820382 RepID=A0AAD5KHH6_9CRUS|nr:hypothetical protein GHT06_022391 [Daphnia sinensis]